MVLGPDGSNYLAIQEALVGGSSDADDAWLPFSLPFDQMF